MKSYLGYSTYREEDTTKMKKLDHEFLACVEKYQIKHWSIPAMISGNILKRCGYFSTLPQQITKISTIKRERLEPLACGCEYHLNSDDYDSSSTMFLTPAACLHFYPMLEEIPAYNEIITTLARVYRYEDGKFECGVRQWDFTVREFVAVGSKEFVTQFLTNMENKLVQLAKMNQLKVNVENANDHFYPNKLNSMKERFQKNNNLKKELVASVNGQNIAIASFNYHDLHFSKEFGFDKKATVVTGCVGCGVDRWIYCINATKAHLDK